MEAELKKLRKSHRELEEEVEKGQERERELAEEVQHLNDDLDEKSIFCSLLVRMAEPKSISVTVLGLNWISPVSRKML